MMSVKSAMACQKKYYIHAGGHRTGSSSVQMCLHQNRARITQAGFDAAYPGRDDIPSGELGLRLPSPRHGETLNERFSKRVAEATTSLSPDPNRPLILSEENIPGRMLHFFNGEFYPSAEARMRALAEGLNGRLKRVLLIVRSYEELYISAHRKRAEDNYVMHFDEMRPALMSMNRGWPALVRAMRDVLQAEETVVVAMSARGDNRNVLRHLVPELEDNKLVEPQAVLNVSATDAALEVLRARYKAGEKLERPEWQQVILEHADETEHRGFAEFSAAESKQLTDLYNRDLVRLSRIKRITFFR